LTTGFAVYEIFGDRQTSFPTHTNLHASQRRGTLRICTAGLPTKTTISIGEAQSTGAARVEIFGTRFANIKELASLAEPLRADRQTPQTTVTLHRG
jgi:hypothetical protein